MHELNFRFTDRCGLFIETLWLFIRNFRQTSSHITQLLAVKSFNLPFLLSSHSYIGLHIARYSC